MQIQPNAALLMIDVQQGFDLPDYWGARNNPEAEANMQRLLQHWRKTSRPIFHIKHNSTSSKSPLNPDNSGNQLKVGFEPQNDEPLIEKTVNSAFIGTDLESRLHAANIQQLIIVGLTTNHCVSTTTRMAGNLDFETYIVHDATATFDRSGHDNTHYPAQLIHDTAIANLHGEFATAISTEELLSL